jgi:hypothetical protein
MRRSSLVTAIPAAQPAGTLVDDGLSAGRGEREEKTVVAQEDQARRYSVTDRSLAAGVHVRAE